MKIERAYFPIILSRLTAFFFFVIFSARIIRQDQRSKQKGREKANAQWHTRYTFVFLKAVATSVERRTTRGKTSRDILIHTSRVMEYIFALFSLLFFSSSTLFLSSRHSSFRRLFPSHSTLARFEMKTSLKRALYALPSRSIFVRSFMPSRFFPSCEDFT